jgi:hypothetical protein
MICKFAQREKAKETEKVRCVNKKCDSFLEIVESDLCSGCPFKVTNAKKCTNCEAEKVKVSSETSETFTSKDLENAGIDIADVFSGKISSNEVTQALNLKVMAEDGKEYPALTVQLMNYQNALRKWQAGGRPVRSPEEIKDILETHCKGCDWYDKEKSRCKGCGCRVSEGGMAIFNKIKMATEHCPLEKW